MKAIPDFFISLQFFSLQFYEKFPHVYFTSNQYAYAIWLNSSVM